MRASLLEYRHAIAQALIDARKKAALSQAQVAEHCGIFRETVAEIENARRSVRAEELPALFEVLQLSREFAGVLCLGDLQCVRNASTDGRKKTPMKAGKLPRKSTRSQRKSPRTSGGSKRSRSSATKSTGTP